jgi:hypothetical protein
MATKWADYVITKVRFNSAKTHIDKVKRRKYEGDKLGDASKISRTSVVSALDAGTTFCTATKDSKGDWQKGAMVKIVTIEGTKYIKTKADGIKKDNLDNLPTF